MPWRLNTLSINKKKHGVTLIELIVALLVLSILSAIAIPSFISLVNNYRISGVAENLYSVLQFARSEAIKKNANVHVTFWPGDPWCYGVNLGTTCDCTMPNPSCSYGTYSTAQAQQMSLSITGLISNDVYFEGSHGAANASGTLTFTLYHSTSLIKITIGKMGNLQICSTGIGGYLAC